MRANQAQLRIATMARVPGASPGTSGFYAWRQRGRSVRERSDEALTARVRAIHAHSRGSYGGAAHSGRAGRAGHAGEPQTGGSGDAPSELGRREPAQGAAHHTPRRLSPPGTGLGGA